MKLKLATRKSILALEQAKMASSALAAAGYQCELMPMSAPADDHPDTPLAELATEEAFGSKALFVKTLEQAVLSGEADVAVHSLKDVAAQMRSPLTLVACLKRYDAGDLCLLKKSVCPVGSDQAADWLHTTNQPLTLATSSLRRKALLTAHGFSSRFVSIRGNIDTRIQKVARSKADGLLVSEAAIARLRSYLDSQLSSFHQIKIEPSVLVPSPGQGVVALQTRQDHPHYHQIAKVSCPDTHFCATLERAIVAYLEGHCQMPMGCYATLSDDADNQLAAHLTKKRVITTSVAMASQCGQHISSSLRKWDAQTSDQQTEITGESLAGIVRRVAEDLRKDNVGAVYKSLGLSLPKSWAEDLEDR